MSNVQALQDVLRHLNLHDFKRGDSSHRHVVSDASQRFEDGPLQSSGDCIVAEYATLRLTSTFQPIVNSANTRIGYKAYLKASSGVARHYNLDIPRLALSVGDRSEIVYLDRLTRTLHALNYLAYELEGDLHMSVNPQHLLEVSGNHGVVFEQILSKCGLETGRIVLEIGDYISNKEHLQLAISGWRDRRYKIAFDGVSIRNSDMARVLKYHPDFIKIDIRVLRSNENLEELREILGKNIEAYRANGIESIATHIDTEQDFRNARLYGFSALQGAWLGQDSEGEQLPLVTSL
ncbi:MAG: EAL domain-containing protein [Spongiibacteraceae bacterium]